MPVAAAPSPRTAGQSSGPIVDVGITQSGAQVHIDRVDSSQFPGINAYFMVTDGEGRPISGLTAADLVVTEDGSPLSTADLTLADDSSQPLHLVLAVDLSTGSTSSDALDRIKPSLLAFVAALGVQDSVAIMTFYDQVQVVQSFTTDKALAQAAIAELNSAGNYTALNKAVTDALDLAQTAPPGRRAVVVVADHLDNTALSPDLSAASAITLADVIAKARQDQITVHTVGFGPNAQVASDLTDFANATGGQAFLFADPDQVGEGFVPLSAMLRRGYLLSFQSKLAADNQSHDLAIGLAGELESNRSSKAFVATADAIRLKLLGLSEGQTVFDALSLSVEVAAPAPIAKVEYLVDGQPIATLNLPPYATVWDSTLTKPGAHALTVRATDRNGTVGLLNTTFTVALPLNVTAVVDKDQVELGGSVDVQTFVNALAPISRVDFLLDGQLIGTNDASTYRYSFDNSPYDEGLHVLTVRAVDAQGRMDETRLNVHFLPPRPTLSQRIASAVRHYWVWILLLIVLAIALIWLLRRLFHRGRFERVRLELANESNVASNFRLSADDPNKNLRFVFTINDHELAEAQVEWAAPAHPTSPPGGEGGNGYAQPATLSPAMMPVNNGHANGHSTDHTIGDTGGGRFSAPAPVGQALATGRKLKGKVNREQVRGAISLSYTLSTIASSLASVLPGQAGRSVRQASAGVSKAQRVAQSGEHVSHNVDRASAQTRQLRGAMPTSIGGAPAPQGQSQSQSQSQSQTQTFAQPNAAGGQVMGLAPALSAPAGPVAAPRAVVRRPEMPGWVVTPVVDAGERLVVDVVIQVLRRPLWRRELPYRVLSQLTADTQATSEISRGTLHAKGTWLYTLALALVIGGIAALIALYFVDGSVLFL